MVAGIDRWRHQRAESARAAPRARARWSAASSSRPRRDGDDIPVVRFPRWHSCPKCKRLDDHYRLTSFDSNKCGDCNRTLVPSRFVMVCPRGHIDDFPYMRWVHEGDRREGDAHELRIEARGATASLRDIVITLQPAARKRTMDKAFDRFALRDVTRCFGNRPWLGKRAGGLRRAGRALQRGASNVWFGSHRSAISIPPWSDCAFQLLDKHWDVLRALARQSRSGRRSRRSSLTAGTSFTTDDLVEAVQETKAPTGGRRAARPRRTRSDATSTARSSSGQKDTPGSQFAAQPRRASPTSLERPDRKVMLVTRLREVRALQGFSRILPPGGGTAIWRRSSASDPGWRPAIEVKGEGIFLVSRRRTLCEPGRQQRRRRRRRSRTRPPLRERVRERWGQRAGPRDHAATRARPHARARAHRSARARRRLSRRLAARAPVRRRRHARLPRLHGNHRLRGQPRRADRPRRTRSARARARVARSPAQHGAPPTRLHRGRGAGSGRPEPRRLPRLRTPARDELRGDEHAARPRACSSALPRTPSTGLLRGPAHEA